MRTFCISILIMTAVSVHAKDKEKPSLEDPVTIAIDNIAFDEDSYLQILGKDNQPIALFDRFENKSAEVKSAKVYNLQNQLVYNLVPIMTAQGYEIHIRDTSNQRGLVKIKAGLSGFSIKYDCQVDYFGEEYEFDIHVTNSMSKVSMRQTISYKGELVMSYQMSSSFAQEPQEAAISANGSFLENKPLDTATWSLILQLINEMTNQTAMGYSQY